MQNLVIDLVIRIKNGYMAGKGKIDAPYSKFVGQVLEKLKSLGYVISYEIKGDEKKMYEIELDLSNEASFTDIAIFSKPGRRYYVSYRDLKPVVSGFGHSILSTPVGILTDREAKSKKMGGELLFKIW